MAFWSKMLSADNSETDVKAVVSILALLSALVIYLAYAIKGLFIVWDMPSGVRDITVSLVLGGTVGAGSTLFNARLGVTRSDITMIDTPGEAGPGPPAKRANPAS